MTGSSWASADLRVLIAEITTTQGLLRQLGDEIEHVRQQHPGGVAREPLALLAVDLHSYYTKIESLLERIFLSFEGQVPRGESAHAGLLRLSFLAVPGIRPAIFDPRVRDALEELRRFRHFFRHAYALDLRADKLDTVLVHFLPARHAIDLDLQAFVKVVETLLVQLES